MGEDLVTGVAAKAEKNVGKIGDKADEVAKGPLGRMREGMDAIGKSTLFTELNMGVELAGRALQALSAGWAELKQAASERSVANSFAAAFGGGADAIERLQAATGGMLADTTLEQLGAQGARAGLSLAQVAKLLDSSTRAAMASGKDVAETAAVFLKSTVEGNDEATKQLGVLVNLGTAQSEYARQIGVTASSLTTAQKAQASLAEITRQTDAAFKNATGDETISRLGRMEAKWANLTAAVREFALTATVGLPEALTEVEDWQKKVYDAQEAAFADALAKGDYSDANIARIVDSMRMAGNVQEAMTAQLALAARAVAVYADEQRRLDEAFAKRAALLGQITQAEKDRITALGDEVRKEDEARFAAVEHARQLALVASAMGSSEQAGERWQAVLQALGTAHVNAADDVLTLYGAIKSSNNEMAKAIELEAELAAAAGDLAGAEALRNQALGVVTGDGGGSKPGTTGKGGGGARKSKLDASLEDNAKATAAGQQKLVDDMWALRAAAEQNALDQHDQMRAEQDAKDMAALEEYVATYQRMQDEMLSSRVAGFDSLSGSILGLRDALGEIDGISLDGLASAAQNMSPLMAQFDALANATDKSKGAMTSGALGIAAASGRMVAGIIKDQRAQAIIMSLVEQAEAWGSFARMDYVGFGAHMVSSALWGAVAGTSGGAKGGGGAGGGSAGGRAARDVARVPNEGTPAGPQFAPVTIHISGGTYLGTDAAKTGRELARMVDMHRGRSFRGHDAGSPP